MSVYGFRMTSGESYMLYRSPLDNDEGIWSTFCSSSSTNDFSNLTDFLDLRLRANITSMIVLLFMNILCIYLNSIQLINI